MEEIVEASKRTYGKNHKNSHIIELYSIDELKKQGAINADLIYDLKIRLENEYNED